MAREKAPPPEKSGDVPEWFMTYSDVITLLMTFFILLLTFASNEPEQFERMQKTMFDSAGGTGVAGQPSAGIERESFVVRMRPSAARVSMRGSEMPPVETDPPSEDVTSALAGLEEDEIRKVTPRSSIVLPLSFLLEDNFTRVSTVGKQHLRMVASQLRRPGIHIALAISPDQDPAPLMVIADHFVSVGLPPGKVGFATSDALKADDNKVRLEIIREERGA
ncbi:MAG: flagellar motor protein MotB [Planctomycetaceae bacterium]